MRTSPQVALARRPVAGELGDGERHQKERGREDRRDHARRVDLERQMRLLRLHLAARRLALGILDQNPPLRPLHEADEEDEDDDERDDRQDGERRHGAGAAALEHLDEGRRKLRDDSGHDDQGDAVADAAAGDLLAKPHQEHGSADERDDGGDPEHHARIEHGRAAARLAPAFQADGDEIALDRAQEDGAVARILVELLAPALALFLEGGEGRRHRGGELNDDGGGDVGHHSERDQAHPLQASAREHVEEIEHPAAGRVEQVGERSRIDARQRDEAQQPEDDEGAESEPKTLLEIGGLGEARQADVGRHLFGCGCHVRSIPEKDARRRRLNDPRRLI